MKIILVKVENPPKELLEELAEIDSLNVAFITKYTPNASKLLSGADGKKLT